MQLQTANRRLRTPTDWLTAKLLLVLASTVILGSDPQWTHDHMLLSDGRLWEPSDHSLTDNETVVRQKNTSRETWNQELLCWRGPAAIYPT
jgi:hypothetical protein